MLLLDSSCLLVFTDLAARLYVLGVTIKEKALSLIGVSTPNDNREAGSLFSLCRSVRDIVETGTSSGRLKRRS